MKAFARTDSLAGDLVPDDKSRPKNNTPVRDTAEKRLSEKSRRKPPHPDDPLALVHELEVHQIKLETQNEDLRNAQLEVEALKEKYFDLYDLAPVGYLTLNEKGIISEMNLTAAGLLGVERKSLINKPLYPFIKPGSQDAFYLHQQDVFRLSAKQTCRLELKKHDGTFFPARLDSTGVEVNGQRAMRSILTDISESAHAEAMLQESELRYRRITEGLTDYFYTVRVLDGQAVQTTHSEACVSVTGYRSEEFAASPYLWLDMIVPDDRGHVIEHANAVLAGKQMAPIEHRIMRKDGQIRWVSSTPIVQVDSQGRLISYDGVIRDITERKRAEDRRHLAHDVLNLLNHPGGIKDTIGDILCLIKKTLGIEAVGIRLNDGEDFPYYVTDGFSEEFVRAEKYLCKHDSTGKIERDGQGNPVLECMCGECPLRQDRCRAPLLYHGWEFLDQ